MIKDLTTSLVLIAGDIILEIICFTLWQMAIPTIKKVLMFAANQLKTFFQNGMNIGANSRCKTNKCKHQIDGTIELMN